MKFKGYLSGLELTDVIQLLIMKRASSIIEIKNNTDEKGILFIEEGRIVYAEIKGKIKGNEAVMEILMWDTSEFKETKWKEPPERNVTLDTMYLMMEAARIKDEQGKSENYTTHKMDKFAQFIKNTSNSLDSNKRLLITIAYNFPEEIMTVILINSQTKTITAITRETNQKIYLQFMKKITPFLKLSKENPLKPVTFPVERDLETLIFSGERYTLVSFLISSSDIEKIIKFYRKLITTAESYINEQYEIQ